MNHQDYSYTRGGKTAYMEKVINYFKNFAPPLKILDIPAGSGVFAKSLEENGHIVVKADIHDKNGFIHANMEQPLPFQDEEFSAVTCLEGIEHLVNPIGLIQELVRVTKPDGIIVISTPNITNLYSRLQFLFTGTFFQFDARSARQTHGMLVDRGHISPFTPLHLIYVLGSLNCKLTEVRIDRAKRKALLPLYLAMKPLSCLWTRKISKGTLPGTYPGVSSIKDILMEFKLMFGRSQILFFQKTKP